MAKPPALFVLLCFLLIVLAYVHCKGGSRGGRFSLGRGRGFASRKSSSSHSFGGLFSSKRSRGRFSSKGRSSFGKGGGKYFMHTSIYHSLQMHRSINYNIEVCNDFYQHACGNWTDRNSSNMGLPQANNQFELLANKIDFNIGEMLQNSTEKAKEVLLLKNCIENGFTNDHRQLAQLVEGILSTKWPIVEQQSLFSNSWYHIYAQLMLLDVTPFFTITISHKREILLHRPKFASKPNETLIHEVISLFAQSDEARTLSSLEIYEIASEVTKLDEKLTLLLQSQANHIGHGQFSLDQLNNITEHINWTQALNQTISTLNSQKVDNTSFLAEKQNEVYAYDWVVVDDIKYLQEMAMIIKTTPIDVVFNFFGWKVIQTYHHLVGGRLRSIFAKYPHHELPVWKRCVDLVKLSYPWAITKRYVQRFITKSNQTAVGNIVKDIKHQFENILKSSTESSWLDSEHSKQTITKLNQMKIIIGPKMEFQTANESAFPYDFDSIIETMRVKQVKKLLKWKANPIYNPLSLKVQYLPSHDFLVIPFGLIQSPFFNESNPRFLNLAALGSLITIELIYSLREHWWNAAHFGKDVNCFSKNYNKLTDSEFKEMFTLEQIISTDRALRLLDDLWQSEYWFNKNREDMFYLQFAQMYCSTKGANSEYKHRVNFALRNLDNFADYYKCDSNSHMVATHSCPLWKKQSYWKVFRIVLISIGIVFCICIAANYKENL